MNDRWRIELYNRIRSGDVEGIKQIPLEQYDLLEPANHKAKGRLSDSPEQAYQYAFVIQTMQVVGLCIENGLEREDALGISYHFIRRLDKAPDILHMNRIYRNMVIDFARRMKLVETNRAYSMNVVKTIDLINEHLNEPILVSDLAEKLRLNTTYLCALFRRETGTTIGRYLMNRRLEKAKDLLQLPNMSYLDIVSELCFCSHSHFIAAFKKYTGLTPKQYREQRR